MEGGGGKRGVAHDSSEYDTKLILWRRITYPVNTIHFVMPERHKVDNICVLDLGQLLEDLDEAILVDRERE